MKVMEKMTLDLLSHDFLIPVISFLSVFVVLIISCASCLKTKKSKCDTGDINHGPVKILSYDKDKNSDITQTNECNVNSTNINIVGDSIPNNRELPRLPSVAPDINEICASNITNNNCCFKSITDQYGTVSAAPFNSASNPGVETLQSSVVHQSSESCEDQVAAAYAISGRAPANPDFPYMTPPLIRSSSNTPLYQPNFSGDSQDSKGYTSISVREPLEHIKACTVLPQPQPPEGYYVAVSDDYDGVYAAIDSGVSGGNSETYAQIDCPGENDVSERCHFTCEDPPLPGKRELNSPLPPAPYFTSHVYSTVNKEAKCSVPTSNLPKSIEDMYSKVNKHKEDDNNENELHNSSYTTSLKTHFNSVETGELPLVSYLTSAAEKSFSQKSSNKSVGDNSEQFTPVGGVKPKVNSNFDAFNSSERRVSKSEINYSDFEIVRDVSKAQQSNVGTPALSLVGRHPSEPNYETIKPKTTFHIHQVDSILTDPGYETVVTSVKDPPYACVNETENCSSLYEHFVKNPSSSNTSLMELENSFSKTDPVYASVKLPNHPPPISLHSDQYKDTNYESVDPDEISENDPNYEILNYQASKLTESDHGYEQIKLQSQEDNEYYETLSEYQSVSAEYPLYEKLKYEENEKPILPIPTTGQTITNVPCYAQVKKLKKDANNKLIEAPNSRSQNERSSDDLGSQKNEK